MNRELVELSDFTKAMFSLDDEYQRFIAKNELDASAVKTRLYVQKLESGSIIAELLPFAPFVLPLMGEVNTVVSFCKHLKFSYEYLLGDHQAKEEKPELERQDLQNLADILEPVAKDHASQINIGTVNVLGPVVVLNSLQANAAQNAARREIAELQQPITGLHQKVLLYWFQARNQPHPKTGDKGVIESISTAPVNVAFADDAIKIQMLGGADNIFRRAYVVDVMVSTIQGKPALYKVLALHDSFERE